MTQSDSGSTTDAAGIALTERAARRIAQLASSEPTAKLFRVSVEGGGCSGFQYRFDMVEAADASDLTIERDGARLVVDSVSLGYLQGSEVDFIDDLMGASFRIRNPNAQSSCGCGTSFTI